MITSNRLGGQVLAALALVTLVAVPALAQSGGPYDLSWSTVDAGGATFVIGSDYTLGGTAGQPDAWTLAGGDFVLEGGFWFGGAAVTGIDDEPDPGTVALPLVYRLYRARPNPFNPRTEIAFDLPLAGEARLAVYDLGGRLVRTLAVGGLPAGHHVRTWDGVDDAGTTVASGVYILTIDAGGFHARQKAVLLK